MQPISVPKLPKGKWFRGPDFYGCCNTGLAPCIMHSKTGKYLVGPEIPCHDAMEAGIQFTDKRVWADAHGRRVWLYKSRKPAVAKFMAMCGAQIMENDAMRRDHAATAAKAAKGDMAAALHLGDF